MTTHVLDLSLPYDDAGDRHERFRQLFLAHFDALYRSACRYLRDEEDAADLVQDVFLKVWRLEPRMPDPLSYLYAAVRNECRNRLKHRRVVERYLTRSGLAQAVVPADEELAQREEDAAIQRAIDTLPRRQREVLQLRWTEGLSYAEIGMRLGIATKTVAEHRNRAVAHLRESLPGMLE